jgi:putative membrane protein
MTVNPRRDRVSRLAVLCLPVAATLVFPSAAMAATGASTVRAVVGGDGSVQTVKMYDSNGRATAFSGTMPLKMSISRSVSGAASTYNYHVENTYSKTQDVSYTDTAGHSHVSSATLQLPLVAQLGVEVPNSFKNVQAPNAVVETDPDGTTRVVFNLVMFSPLGSPTQDVSFTADGSGVPTAELVGRTVNPASTPGLSSASSDATASFQQDDFWSSYANGGNGGLTQLADGMGQLVAGLQKLAPGTHQLADGIKAAGAGAILLDNGTKQAYDGEKKIAPGSAAAYAGAKKLAAGSAAALDGSKKLDAGSHAAADGSTKLAAGAHQVADGAGTLSTGLGALSKGQTQLDGGIQQISAGLNTLDASTPAAVAGITAIKAGVEKILVALQGVGGSTAAPKMIDATTPSILLGLTGSAAQLGNATGGIAPSVTTARQLVQAAIQTIEANEVAIAGAITPATVTTLLTNLGTAGAAAGDPAFAGSPLANGGILPGVEGGLTSTIGGLKQLTAGLDAHAPGTNGATDPGGVDYGLAALLDPTRGLPAAVAGIHALATGAAAAAGGSTQLKAGAAQAADGGAKLAAGAGQVATGADALSAGLGQIAPGLDALTGGLAQIAPGNKSLADGLGQLSAGDAKLLAGLGQLSAGQHKVATGLPAAVSGSKQIADGTDQVLAGSVKVKDGILAVQSGAMAPLLKQLTEGSQNARKTVATIEAAGALASEAPGGANTSYVLTQSADGFRLAAASSAANSGESHTARNVGIGLGGVAALIVAVVAGFALGRRSSTVSV